MASTDGHAIVDTAQTQAPSSLEAGRNHSSISGGKESYLSHDIHNYLTSFPILSCCFASGLIDSNVFNAWGVFASMQTGNTVILALGASSRPTSITPYAWLQALLAIVFFFLGAFFSCRILSMLFACPLKRWALAASFGLQATLIAVSAALIQARSVPGLDVNGPHHPDFAFIQLAPLVMLAFQAGQQCVAARELGLNEIPTTVLTSVYCDLGNDHKLFAPLSSNWKRNRRFASAVLILMGAIAGGWLSRTNIGMAAGLWMASGIKYAVCIAWLFWPNNSKSSHVT